jgi:hypothetical protein
MPKVKREGEGKGKGTKYSNNPYSNKPYSNTKNTRKNKNPNPNVFDLLTKDSDDDDENNDLSNTFFSPANKVNYVKNINPITTEDIATKLPYEYRTYFIEKYLDPIREEYKVAQTNQTNQTNQSFINSLNLQKKTYIVQVNEFIIDQTKKQIFDKLYYKYCFQLDYIDMVHDITNCFDYILNILDINSEYYNILSNLIKELCGGKYAGIRIKKSHELQKKLLSDYINELRLLGFILPDIEEPISVTAENCNDTLSDVKKCGRESGGYLDNFLNENKDKLSNEQQNILVNNEMRVPNNSLGAIDGCRGDCIKGSEIEWTHTVAGIFVLNIKTNGTKSRIKVTLFDREFIFNVTGEIVLDDIIDHLKNDKIPFRGKVVDRDNNISFESVANHEKDSMFCSALISLKTICDKRLLQLIQTDYTKNTRLDAFTTIDSYVPAGTFLAYLGGKIAYCPSILLTRNYGYDRYDYDKSNNLVNELVERYYFYNEYSKYFKGYENVNTTIKNALDFTSSYLDQLEIMISNPDYIYQNFWDYIRLNGIKNQKEIWENKKEDLKKKLKNVENLLNDPEREIKKNELINAFLSIPTIIPSISDFFEELENEEDTIDVLHSNIELSILSDAFYKRDIKDENKNILSHKEKIEIFKNSFPNVSIWHNLPVDDITKFVKKYKLKVSATNFLPEYDGSTFLFGNVYIDGNININGNNLTIYYKETEAKIANNLVEEYNSDDTVEPIKLYQYYNNNNNRYVYAIYLPINAELLINIAFKLPHILTKGRNIINAQLKLLTLITKIGKKLFEIVGIWLNLDNSKEDVFVEFLRKSINLEYINQIVLDSDVVIKKKEFNKVFDLTNNFEKDNTGYTSIKTNPRPDRSRSRSRERHDGRNKDRDRDRDRDSRRDRSRSRDRRSRSRDRDYGGNKVSKKKSIKSKKSKTRKYRRKRLS